MALMAKALVPTLLTAGGAVLLVLGVWAIYPPAGVIAAGIVLLTAGLLPDWGV